MFNMGDYIYYIDHSDETIERFKIVSYHKADGHGFYLLVSNNTTMVIEPERLCDEFMTAHQIYEYIVGLSVVESVHSD